MSSILSPTGRVQLKKVGKMLTPEIIELKKFSNCNSCGTGLIRGAKVLRLDRYGCIIIMCLNCTIELGERASKVYNENKYR